MKHLAVLAIIIATTFGCIIIPDPVMVENQRGDIYTVYIDNQCFYGQRPQSQIVTQKQRPELNAAGFSLMNWNLQKESIEGWQEDFMRLSKEKDLLIIQEACLASDLRRLLTAGQYHWNLVTAFLYNGEKSGVLTVSKIEPDLVCPLRSTEPLFKVPKTILITRYPLSNTHRSLLVANIHLINFTIGTLEYQDQLNKMVQILAEHNGPLILSGDFNTWSRRRMAIVDSIADRLQLKPVRFKENDIREVFGLTVDHIYYRGLEPIRADVVKVNSSDHNPMLVRFKLSINE